MMIKITGRSFFLLNLILVLSLIATFTSMASAGEMTIKPGKFDHFVVSLPDRAVAGENVSIKIQAVDSLDNLISNFGDLNKEFQISVTGSATVNPASFKSSAFANGVFSFALNDKVSESVTLVVREVSKPIPLLTKDLFFVPNKLASFVLSLDRPVALAGETFHVKITAKDSYGNKVTETVPGKNLNLIFRGEAEPKVSNAAIPDFREGYSLVALVSEKTGTFTMEVKDLITGSAGISEKIEIVNGTVASFKLFTPKEVLAGEPFELSLVALDRFGNVATNYALTGRGVEITSSGKMKPFPSSLPAYEFTNGQARVSLRYEIPENIMVGVQEVDGKYKSMSDLIKIVAPVPERFEITTPDSEVAGQKFKIKITVYNQLGHVIKSYNQMGPDVELSTTGSGVLTPRSIPASEFVNGTAIVEVQYNKSESFSIVATPMESGFYLAPAATKKSLEVPARKISKDTTKKDPIKEIAPATKQKKTKKNKDEGKKKVETKTGKTTLEVTNISLVEAKKKSSVSVHIPNFSATDKYSVYKETVNDKKFVVLKIKPAVSKIEKQFKSESSFIGSVLVEEDKNEKDALLVKIELFKPARFHVTKDKNAITVTLKR